MSTDPVWTIDIAQGSGDVRKVTVRAADEVAARLASGVHVDRIVRVRRNWIGPLLEPAPSLKIQQLLVTQIAAIVASSSDLNQVPNLVQARSELRATLERSGWTPAKPLSELFTALHFDSVVTALTAAGEQSGRLFDLLKNAQGFLTSAQSLSRSNAGHLVIGAILALGGISIMLGMPVFLGADLDRFADTRSAGLAVHTTLATDIMLWLRDGGTSVLSWGLLALLCAVLLLWWKADKLNAGNTFPVLQRVAKPVQWFRRARRGAILLSTLSPLYSAGVDAQEMIRLSRSALGPAGDALANAQQTGLSLSDALKATAQWWSPTLLFTAANLESLRPDARALVFDALIDAMLEEQAEVQRHTAIGLYVLGGLLAMSSMAMMALGFVLPMMSVGL